MVLKYFKRIVQNEQKKCVTSSQTVNVSSAGSIVSFNNVISNVNVNVVPELTTSLANDLHSDYSFDQLPVEPTELKDYIHCVDISNSVQLLDQSTLVSKLENDATNNLTISDKLQLLITQYKVSHNFCNSLLQVLKSEGLDVPKDVRTLMKTPKNHTIVNISGGSYIHLGLKHMLLPILSRNNAQKYMTSHILKIGINLDGLPISKSSKSQLWPILISVLNFKELKENVMPIGIFHGFKKSDSIEEFLNPFIRHNR